MVDSDKNIDVAWRSFEESGSIEAFLVYHQSKLLRSEEKSGDDAGLADASKNK